jgi:hypothetical protein
MSRFRADRSAERGIAGHEAVMKALGNAAGFGSREVNSGWDQTVRLAYSRKKSNNDTFVPGQGNVKIDKAPEQYQGVKRNKVNNGN